MKPKMPDTRRPKPGLWPPGRPRATQSHAEQKVYEALAAGLPKGWYAWHSFRIRRRGCTETEIDFVIADPSQGILIVEVKGGRIEERDGLWYSNGQPLEPAPREQANRFRHELIELLRSRDILLPPCGIATFFPDTEFGKQPGQSDMAGCVLGKQDLLWLADALPDLMKRALPQGYKPKGNWLGAIHSLWGETWIPKFDFGLHRRLDEEERLRLDHEQFIVLQGLMGNRSLLVEGAAGTGKTVLAMETARRLAAEGKQVLVLCFTEPLAHWLVEQIDAPSPSVWAVKRYAVELLRQSGTEVTIEDTPAFWSAIALQAVADALPKLNLAWDAVIVDEGQDFSEDDWLLVEEISRDKFLWGFWDPDQAFWADRPIRKDLFKTSFRLPKQYRCPEAIRMLAGRYRGETAHPELLQEAVQEGVIGLNACPCQDSVVARLGVELDKLRGSGYQPADIAILSVRGGAVPGSVVHLERISSHRIVRAHDPEAGFNVVAETFLRFKGLERPAIIITDLHLALDRENFSKRMYIALTRALSTVRIVDTRDSLLRDPVISVLCK